MDFPYIIILLALGSVWLFIQIPSIEYNKTLQMIFRGMIVLANILILSVVFTQPSNAAEVTVKQYPNGSSYVSLEGFIDDGDDIAIAKAVERVGPTYDLVLNSPGGRWDIMLNIVKIIKAKPANTLAIKQCTSACAVIWSQGSKRAIVDNTIIGFHVASVQQESLAMLQSLYGFAGLQKFIQQTVADSLLYYSELPNIAKPIEFVKGILTEGNSLDTTYLITRKNSHIIGKDVIWFK